ncbi:MAG: TonB-dependent receptor, partial [Bacteroidota bacterium]
LYLGQNLSVFQPEPRLAFEAKLIKDWSMVGSWNINQQFLQQISSSRLSLPNETWVFANEDLPPLLGQQWALGLQSPEFPHWRFQIEAYYRTGENLVLYQPDEIELEFVTAIEPEDFYFDGESRSRGIEVLTQFHKNKWRLWLSYTLSRSEMRYPTFREGTWLPNFQDRPHSLQFVASKKVSYRWEYALSWNLQSGRPILLPAGSFVDINGQAQVFYSDEFDRFPTYHRLDINFTYRPRPDRRTKPVWRFGVLNAYNRANPIVLESRPTSASSNSFSLNDA